MSKLFPANRVVLLLHGTLVVLTIVGIYIAAVQGSLPKSWQANVALAAGVVAALVAGTTTVLKFLDGAQKSEALQVTQSSTDALHEAAHEAGHRAGVRETAQNLASNRASTSDQVVEQNIQRGRQVWAAGENAEEGPALDVPEVPEDLDSAAWLSARSSMVV